MTDEELKYYTVLQSVFKKNMGVYKQYDKIMGKSLQEGVIGK